MAKKLGPSLNRGTYVGRVVGNPTIANGWAKFYLKTLVAEPTANGGWDEVECLVPMMTNDPKKIEVISQYVQDERQLIVEGYIKSWNNANGGLDCAVMITTIKLGSKTMFDPDAQGQAQAPVTGTGAPPQTEDVPPF